VFTEQKYNKQLIWKAIGAECNRPYVVDGTCGLAVIRCWYAAMTEVTLASVIVPKYFTQTQHSENITQETVDVRRYSIAGANLERLLIGVGWRRRRRRGIHA